MKKILFIIALGFIIALLIPHAGSETKSVEQPRDVVVSDTVPLAISERVEEERRNLSVILEVPFFAQAPLGDWDDPRQQDGCEEASILMAHLWAMGASITLEEAREQIIAISEYEKANGGNFRDTSARDTAQLMRDYFGYGNVQVEKNITITDIKNELLSGNLVIVLVNGQRLGNPFYTLPGPTTHMLVITGYDEATGEFITNDVGTRRGEGFRYSETVLSAALQDYPTGYHEPQVSGDTAMIVVGK